MALIGFILAFFVPIAGVVLGILAHRQLSDPMNPETGRGLAISAIVIGAARILLDIALFFVWLSIVGSVFSHIAPHLVPSS